MNIELKDAIADLQSTAIERIAAQDARIDALTKALDGNLADANRRKFAAPSHSDEPAGEWRDEHGKPLVAITKQDHGRVVEKMGRGTPDYSLADFFRAVAGAKAPEPAQKALAVGTDSAGGYAVPTVLMPQFIDALAPVSSLMRAGAVVLPLDASAKTFRAAKVATIPTAAWRSEAGAVVESDPAFGVLDLTPQSLAFYFRVSRELLMDSPNIDGALQRLIAQAFAKELDRAGLRGSGTPPEPRGLLNIVGVNAVTNGAAGTALGTIKWSNLTTAYQNILDANGPAPTAAIMAPRTLTGFAALADSTGQPLQRPDLLRPIEFIATSQLPVNLTVGGSTDCSEMFIGDFREFVIGLREDVSIMRADQLFAANGQVAFICHMRVDVGATWPAAFAKVTGIRP